MSGKLVGEVIDWLLSPAAQAMRITPNERMVLVTIAERSNDNTREMWRHRADDVKLNERIAGAVGVSTKALGGVLARLAERGLECRVPIGVDSYGMSIFAVKGKAMSFRLPEFPASVSLPGPGQPTPDDDESPRDDGTNDHESSREDGSNEGAEEEASEPQSSRDDGGYEEGDEAHSPRHDGSYDADGSVDNHAPEPADEASKVPPPQDLSGDSPRHDGSYEPYSPRHDGTLIPKQQHPSTTDPSNRGFPLSLAEVEVASPDAPPEDENQPGDDLGLGDVRARLAAASAKYRRSATRARLTPTMTSPRKEAEMPQDVDT